MKTVLAIVMIIIVVLLVLSPILIYKSSAKEVTFTVKSKERINKSESSYYLVWTNDGRVYKDSDNIIFWKFNSSDIYGDLEPGKTFRAKVAGWRIRFLSMYENIIEIHEKQD
jgi:hypothetical protein